MSKSVKSSFGNILIGLSLISFVFIFYPYIRQNFKQISNSATAASPIEANNYFLQIPKIGIYSQIFINIDPWNEIEYEPVLQKGVAMAKNSSLPGEAGTVFLFGHSSERLDKINDLNTPFFRLNRLVKGDRVVIKTQNKEYQYIVVDKKEVWPKDTQFIKDLKKDQLILMTCAPVGTNLKRLLVFATPA